MGFEPYQNDTEFAGDSDISHYFSLALIISLFPPCHYLPTCHHQPPIFPSLTSSLWHLPISHFQPGSRVTNVPILVERPSLSCYNYKPNASRLALRSTRLLHHGPAPSLLIDCQPSTWHPAHHASLSTLHE